MAKAAQVTAKHMSASILVEARVYAARPWRTRSKHCLHKKQGWKPSSQRLKSGYKLSNKIAMKIQLLLLQSQIYPSTMDLHGFEIEAPIEGKVLAEALCLCD